MSETVASINKLCNYPLYKYQLYKHDNQLTEIMISGTQVRSNTARGSRLTVQKLFVHSKWSFFRKPNSFQSTSVS